MGQPAGFALPPLLPLPRKKLDPIAWVGPTIRVIARVE